MISDVTKATQIQQVAQSTPVNQGSTQSKPQPTTTDTVQLSSTALQEANETPVQTFQEASRGDMQAQRLLARQAAARGATKMHHSIVV